MNNAMEKGMITVTFGLILGGILGGPAAKYLITKHKLTPEENSDQVTIGAKEGTNLIIDYHSSLKVLLMVALSMGLGIQMNKFRITDPL